MSKARIRRTLSAREGMSLVELMISVVVMGIGILGVAMMFPYGSESSTDDRNLTHAVELAQQKMEQLRTKVYTDPDLTEGWHPDASGEMIGPSSKFNRRWSVVQLGGTQMTAKYIEVQVTWESSRPDTVKLVTYIKR